MTYGPLYESGAVLRLPSLDSQTSAMNTPPKTRIRERSTNRNGRGESVDGISRFANRNSSSFFGQTHAPLPFATKHNFLKHENDSSHFVGIAGNNSTNDFVPVWAEHFDCAFCMISGLYCTKNRTRITINYPVQIGIGTMTNQSAIT